MRICLVNTFDSVGGAARACSRLRAGLVAAGADSTLIVREKIARGSIAVAKGSRYGGRLRALLDYLPQKLYPHRQAHNFSSTRVPTNTVNVINALSPELVHLHWIPQGFVNVEHMAKVKAPIVWTLHDSWPFTGGCHLPGACRRFESQCGACPVLGSAKENDLSRRGWLRKLHSYPLGRMTLIAPSRWMAARAKASSLLGNCAVEVIPNGVDTRLYSPGEQAAARDRLGLPRDLRLILFGAWHALSDPNKGFDLLRAAVAQLPADLRAQSMLVLLGESSHAPLPALDMAAVNLGEIADESVLVSLYRAVDVLVVPSREENLPNMISEAMACGLPCVAFEVGGIADQIHHRVTGGLAPPYDTGALAAEIARMLQDDAARTAMSRCARDHAVANYALDGVARRHLNLYHRLLADR